MLGHSMPGSMPVRFQSKWVSGFFRNPSGGIHFPCANRCLEVILTDKELRMRMISPFGFLFGSKQGNYKQNIPLSQVIQVEKSRLFGWWHTVRVTFTTDTHQQRCLELGFTGPFPQIGGSQLRKRDLFVQILQEVQHNPL